MKKRAILLFAALLTVFSISVQTAFADNDGSTVQMGLEACSSYPIKSLNTSIDCVTGLYSTIHGDNPNWGQKYLWTNSNVWELDY